MEKKDNMLSFAQLFVFQSRQSSQAIGSLYRVLNDDNWNSDGFDRSLERKLRRSIDMEDVKFIIPLPGITISGFTLDPLKYLI